MLRVATRVVPPLVIDQSGVLRGFDIDLWNSIADRLKAKTNYRIAEDVGVRLETVRSGNADLGISAISITSTREVEFDFFAADPERRPADHGAWWRCRVVSAA